MTMTALRCEGWGNEECINEWKMKQKRLFYKQQAMLGLRIPLNYLACYIINKITQNFKIY